MRLSILGAIIVLCVGLGGCADLAPLCLSCHSEAHNSSSLVGFLYPHGAEPPARDQIPELHLPLRVGLTFLPQSNPGPSTGLDAAQREVLLDRIREHFRSRKFVSEIVVIPDYYLTGARGFESLQGVQRLYNIDLMALVSYDQVTNQDVNAWSIAYWTIAGAYLVKGSRYDVATLVDLAVIDPATRSLVLRAGGTDTRHGNATMIAQRSELRASSNDGFSAATNQMMEHFDQALDKFQSDVHAGTANVRVVRSSDSAASQGGAGAFAWLELLLLLPFAVTRVARLAGLPARTNYRCQGMDR
jgi:rhombotail lipoprotein